ncbi:class I SAM-dependent rRNA methyltransferase [Babesia caballi]|uniref:Class I SAM-dependent rRNA methyltransferase n=1 Tax=Babesia caballi TaxID=5871 RepID=A0AAV4LTM7_BABCB|nr:class I SAM-dependent rRNA methyltransferase [Babesia caballi]
MAEHEGHVEQLHVILLSVSAAALRTHPYLQVLRLLLPGLREAVEHVRGQVGRAPVADAGNQLREADERLHRLHLRGRHHVGRLVRRGDGVPDGAEVPAAVAGVAHLADAPHRLVRVPLEVVEEADGDLGVAAVDCEGVVGRGGVDLEPDRLELEAAEPDAVVDFLVLVVRGGDGLDREHAAREHDPEGLLNEEVDDPRGLRLGRANEGHYLRDDGPVVGLVAAVEPVAAHVVLEDLRTRGAAGREGRLPRGPAETRRPR